MTTNIPRLACLVLAAALCGCATTPPGDSRVEAEMGLAVQEMIERQTADPGAAERNADRTGPGIDGEMAGEVLDVYRSDVSRPGETTNQVIFTVGD